MSEKSVWNGVRVEVTNGGRIILNVADLLESPEVKAHFAASLRSQSRASDTSAILDLFPGGFEQAKAAKELQDAVAWIEANNGSATRHDGFGAHKASWTVWPQRRQSVGNFIRSAPTNAATLPEAVSQLRQKVEGEKA